MAMVTPAVAPASTAPRHDTTAKHIRGSSLLLIGRLLAVAINFAVQVLTVRYLSMSDYGAFAAALAAMGVAASLSVFGLDKAIGRFVPIYQEQRDYNKVFGTMIMMVGTILGLGLTLILLVYGFQSVIGESLVTDPQAVALLLILIVLAPVQALDELLVGMFAIFASPRAIFFRKHLLGPGLKLCVVLGLILTGSNAYFLAGGYLVAGVLGVTLYAVMLVWVLRKQQLLPAFNVRAIKLPAREIFSFTVPLLASDLVFMLRSSLALVLLAHFHPSAEVAAFGAVLPVARLNLVVLQSFTFLFTPMAARMFARKDEEGINNLYWQSAMWLAIITFPVFAVSFALAQPLTLLLFGARYEQSGIVLAVLALGHYLTAALGFNSLTLRVYGKVRYLVATDIFTALLSVGAYLLVIPHYGALGAAVVTCGTMVVQRLFYQAGLRFGTGVSLFEWRYLKVYLIIALGAVGSSLVQWMTAPSIFLSFPLAALVSLIVIWFNRSSLNIAETFPELLRLPLARRVLSR